MKIDIITDNNLIIPEYIIDIKNKSKKTIELIEHFEKLKNLDQQKLTGNIIELKDKKKFKKKPYRKKKFFKKAK
jgi:ribonuclease E